jgi:hypothetical protein
MEQQEISSDLLHEFSMGAENLEAPDALPLELKNVYCSDGFNLYDKTIAVAKAILVGLPFAQACLQAGSSATEISGYMRMYPRVARALNYAVACNMAWWIAPIKAAASRGDIKAATFYLERMWPNIFAEVKAVTRRDTSPSAEFDLDNTSKETDVKRLSDAELVALMDREKE